MPSYMIVAQKCLWTLIAMPLLPVSSMAGQVDKRAGGENVHVRIETDRQTYRAGDSIMVRLTLRNVSSRAIRFVNDAPSNQVRLVVRSTAGQKIDSISSRPGQHSPLSTRSIRLNAGEEMTLQYDGHTWMNLRDWGYDLRMPGRYTLVGIPIVGGLELKPEIKTVRSNEATFTIEP